MNIVTASTAVTIVRVRLTDKGAVRGARVTSGLAVIDCNLRGARAAAAVETFNVGTCRHCGYAS